jgi:hypothetical protein
MFKEIPPNTKIRLLLSGVTIPGSAFTVDLKIVQKKNRININLNTATASSPGMAAAPASTSCIDGPSYSEDRVGFLFDMIIQPCITSNV